MSSETDNFVVVTSDAPTLTVEPEAGTVVADSPAPASDTGTESTDKKEAEPAPSTDAPAPDGDPKPSDDATADAPAKPKRSAQKRINKAIAQKSAAEAKAAELERANKQLQAELEALKTPAPAEDDYDDYGDYLAARDEHDQSTAQAMEAISKATEEAGTAPPVEVSTALEVIKSAIEAADDLPEDFEALVYAEDLALTQDMIKSIGATEDPRDVLYALAKDKAKAAEIANMDPAEQMRAIFAIEFGLSQPQPKPSTASRAPAPISPVSTNSETPRKTPHEMSFTEYEAYMRQREQSRR